MRKPIAALLLAGLFTAGGADPAAAQELDRSEIETVVREYLLANPEVIVEALSILESREAERRAAAQARVLGDSRDLLERHPDSPVGGNPDGSITVVEFFDYNCAFCKRALPTKEALLEADGDIRYVYKEFPILAESSRYAARMALAVHFAQPGLYEPMHSALLEHQGTLTEEAVRAIAEDVGVDLDRILEEMEAPRVAEEIDRNLRLARALGIGGTPTFVIGDAVVAGAQPLPVLQEAVAAERQ